MLVYFTIDLATDVWRASGEVTIESPSPRMDIALPHVFWAAKAHHADLFRTPPMLKYAEATGSTEITLPLCSCGMDMQKYVTVLATRGAAQVLAPLHGLAKRAYGLTTAGARGGLQTAKYPYIFCVLLACSHLYIFCAVLACSHLRLPMPGVDSSGCSQSVVLVALGAVDSTDPPHMMTDTDHGIARSISGWMVMFVSAAVSWAVRGQGMPSLCMFLATYAMLGLVVTGADYVSTACLLAPLRGYTVWMEVPRGFPSVIDGVPMLCKLKMALYGLKQSAREWALTLISWLIAWGFVQCCSDRYMFVYEHAKRGLISQGRRGHGDVVQAARRWHCVSSSARRSAFPPCPGMEQSRGYTSRTA